ncbi:polysaccharide deacetylase family protein [Alicyclobacillus ferrooxydans]|uniref:polysaccharide deacetylase family protein n=1 Tax=Alicyclobacillus ferrooxydans TaxID=471514 RepID=UPI0006D54D84|nr:polysaccharide deacetylase family protein [Alicyclobacillus ferrooxydans]
MNYTSVPKRLVSLFVLLACVVVPLRQVEAAPKKVMYFTFDDGPGAIYTPQILDILRRERVHATFFVLGNRCKELPGVVRRIQNEGHELGSHGYDHRNLASAPFPIVKSEITLADTAIEHVVGRKPIYYRPPFGAIDRREIPAIRRIGHKVSFWTVDSVDWSATSASTIVQNVERAAGPGSVVLFHDGLSTSRFTIQALPILIRYYRDRGYEFRTL